STRRRPARSARRFRPSLPDAGRRWGLWLRGRRSRRSCRRGSRPEAPELGEVSVPFHLTSQRQEVSPPRALQELGESQVNELTLGTTPEPLKPLADKPIVELDIGPAHDMVSSTRL